MAQIDGWKIYPMNDETDWMVAHTQGEARIAYAEMLGVSVKELIDDELCEAELHELDDDELDRRTYHEEATLGPDIAGSQDSIVRRSFREELQRRIAKGDLEPELFATTNY